MTQPVERAGSGAGATTEAAPLGRVDPVRPGTATAVVRAPLGLATFTLVVGFFVLVATLVVLASLVLDVRRQQVFALDAWATPFLHGLASPWLDVLMNRLTDVGSTLVIIPAFLVAAGALLWRRRFGAVLFLAIVSLGSMVLDGAMKVLLARPRPVLDWARPLPDYSFPSGHTMNATVFWVALALIAWSIFGRRVGLASLALAALIVFGVGTSRIYLGFHYLTDVVGGVLAGIAWLMVVGAALQAGPAWRHWRSPASPTGDGPDAPRPEASR